MKGTSILRLSILVSACLVAVGALLGVWHWQSHKIHLGHQDTATATTHPAIPANASPEMKEFLQNQATLADKMEQARRQSPHGVLDPKMFIQFRQQNAELLTRQNQLATIVAQQQSKDAPSAPPLQIPPKASPELQTYLKLRDQLLRDEIAFMNQHKTDDLTSRQSAMQKWRQENAPRFQQLQQLAQSLPQTASTVQTK